MDTFSLAQVNIISCSSEIHWIVDQHAFSTMRNDTINAFQKEFKILSTYFSQVLQSLMLCPILLSEKKHRITGITSKNHMTPRKPYKMNKVSTYCSTPLLRYTNNIKISSFNSKSVINILQAINEFNIYVMYLICMSCAIALLSFRGNNIDKGSI